MDQTTEQTALFFGFLDAAMTRLSDAQPAPEEASRPTADGPDRAPSPRGSRQPS
jgi:hypothetical protein